MALWSFLLVARANSIEMPEQTGFGDPADVRAAVRRTERGATTRGRRSALGAHSQRAAELRARRVRRDADSVMVNNVVRPCITFIPAIGAQRSSGARTANVAVRLPCSLLSQRIQPASRISQPAAEKYVQPSSASQQCCSICRQLDLRVFDLTSPVDRCLTAVSAAVHSSWDSSVSSQIKQKIIASRSSHSAKQVAVRLP